MTAFEIIAANLLAFVSVWTVVGLLVGSFLNVVIYRLPIMLERGWQQDIEHYRQQEREQDPAQNQQATTGEASRDAFNLVTPRSRCSNCLTQISAIENIPVLSYLVLGGKCRHCKTSISARYPLVELITALISGVVAWHFFASPLAAMAALLLSWCLIALTGIDYDTYLLPDNITLPLIWMGLIANYFELFTTLDNALWGAIGGYLILWCVFWLFKLITGKDGMGYGDFKLLAALGAWLGWQMLPVIIILSSLVGAIVGIALIAAKRQDKNKPIPYGPYLAAAGWIALVWGQQLNEIYTSIL